jgi:hypothetical protein
MDGEVMKMGMYTQVRGWLNIDSIGLTNRYYEAQIRLLEAKNDFMHNEEYKDIRRWVCNDTIYHCGSNDVSYLFIGSELKNYDDDALTWIKYLLKYFPNAEGRIDFQYEEEIPGESESRYLLIYQGEIIKNDTCDTWCDGYGNKFK